MSDDPVNHPKHYMRHPSGIECIDVIECMGFNLGNAMKYLWREGLKGKSIEDLQKAIWYINREIANREKGSANSIDIESHLVVDDPSGQFHV